MVGPSQVAASSSTVLVESVTAVELPPMIPAMLAGTSPEQTTMSSAESSRSVPRRSTTCSPGFARRTTTSAILPPPASTNRSRSKAWSGWPSSWSTKLVMSTTLLIGRSPTARSRWRSHPGDGPTTTPSITRAAKRGQPSRVLDPDLGAQLRRRGRQQLLGDRRRGLVERFAECGRQLAGDADVAQAVRPVGGDVEVEDRVEGQDLAERLSRASPRRG